MTEQKPVQFVAIPPPPASQRRGRDAQPTAEGQATRYTLPHALKSHSPVGYRTRLSLNEAEAKAALRLLSLSPPTAFIKGDPITEQQLFEQCSLGVLSARQSTNYRGQRQICVGPEHNEAIEALLTSLNAAEGPPLKNAALTSLYFYRPYLTPFTFLLTFVGHKPYSNLLSVPMRAFKKWRHGVPDIPTIGFLPELHLGILADAVERAAIIASAGARRAKVFMEPFSREQPSTQTIRALETLAGLSQADRRAGWRLGFISQVGTALPEERPQISPETLRKVGANLLAFRSERIQPGVNAEPKAPAQYQQRQEMDIPEKLAENAGRAGYNAFSHWTGCSREHAKRLLLIERVDVLTPNGRERLREIRHQLEQTTDQVVHDLPLWVDLPTGRKLSRAAARGKKAFALAGQRIYIGGLSRPELRAAKISWTLGLRAMGAAASRSALVAEISGATEIPALCDLLGGVCLMAGPINQNDVAKQFYGADDLLSDAFPDRDPTSLIVWTLKAKTVADPIGNEEQLMNPKRKGALVDLRAAPHEVVHLLHTSGLTAMRAAGNTERAFSDQHNFQSAPNGDPIPGNLGEQWPTLESERTIW